LANLPKSNHQFYKKKLNFTLKSHPIGFDGQNHIVAVTPLKFLPPEEFQKWQKSIDSDKKAIMASNPKTVTEVIQKKINARKLKEKGNVAFMKKKFEDAERCYSEAIQLNIGYRPFWTNRAKCRNVMNKYEDAISDCDSALSIDPKCTKSITEKGNALLGLKRFDEAKECYESLRLLGEDASVEKHLKKLHEVQETDFQYGFRLIKWSVCGIMKILVSFLNQSKWLSFEIKPEICKVVEILF